MFGGGGGVSGDARLENANPRLREAVGKRQVTSDELDEEVTDAIDDREVIFHHNVLNRFLKLT